jgi:hypothetical protein
MSGMATHQKQGVMRIGWGRMYSAGPLRPEQGDPGEPVRKVRKRRNLVRANLLPLLSLRILNEHQ